MKCLKCPKFVMHPILTKKGILIDRCPSCRGVWLDHGEIDFFVSDRNILKQYHDHELKEAQMTSAPCPKCQSSMEKGLFPGFSFHIEKCSSCKGFYLNAKEFEQLKKNNFFKNLKQDFFKPAKKSDLKKLHPLHIKLPSLAFTSGVVGLTLYGILFGIVVFAAELMNFSLWIGLAIYVILIFLQFYFSPIFLDWQLKWIGSLDWVPLNQLPSHFKNSLMKLCHHHRLPIPRVGIIHDNAPEAYTYGRTPYSARVVFSEGMFKLLDEDEIETVLAHELGHIKHWDFVLMTVMKIVPMLLYNIYTFTHKLQNRKNIKQKGSYLVAVSIVAYISYLISEYLVLFISRVREYYADRFSCLATKKPNKLMTALVKISYGLLNTSPAFQDSSYKNKKLSMEALNIMSISQSKQLATLNKSENQLSAKTIEDVMRWDLWNPWSFYYELFSTHPLTAKRIHAIGSYAISLNQQPYISFKREKPESYWDDFLKDLFVVLLPWIAGLTGVIFYISYYGRILFEVKDELHAMGIIGTVTLCCALGSLFKTTKVYPSFRKFFSCSISALLKIVKVSPVRSYPITLSGQIIGRGKPGSILSEDLFLQDKTGMIFLDHEPFGLNIWFAIQHFKEKYKDKKVIVKGWYRRSPTPYVEVKSIQSPHHQSKAYTYHYKIAFGILWVIIGGSFLAFKIAFH